jgi:hypothetical protein
MDFGAAFSFVTADEEWVKKLAIGSALALAGILTLGLALIPVAGWALAITRRVSEGTEPVLPEWTNFGELVMDGLKMVAISLIWSLPLIIISACLAGATALLSGDDGGTVPALISTLISCVSIPYSLLLALLLPASYGHLAYTDEFGASLNPANAFKIFRENIGAYVIVALVYAFLVPIVVSIGALVCLIGAFPAIAYTTAVMGHLMGQAYKGAKEAGFELAASS